MDVLDDESILEKIVLALGGDWTAIQTQARPLKAAIEQQKPWLNAIEVAKGIRKTLDKVPSTGEFPKELRGKINEIFRKASPWDAVKDAGEAAIPAGQPTSHYRNLQGLCNRIGLWIVPVGELEGFCKSVGGHGPRWVQQVIENYDISTDKQFERARTFMHEIWTKQSSIANK